MHCLTGIWSRSRIPAGSCFRTVFLTVSLRSWAWLVMRGWRSLIQITCRTCRNTRHYFLSFSEKRNTWTCRRGWHLLITPLVRLPRSMHLWKYRGCPQSIKYFLHLTRFSRYQLNLSINTVVSFWRFRSSTFFEVTLALWLQCHHHSWAVLILTQSSQLDATQPRYFRP